LKSLTQLDEKLLCGRADVIREIVENCQAERPTVLSSEPGFGVTSLIQAGLVPVLKRKGFIVATFSGWQGRFFATEFREAVANAVRDNADTRFFAQGEDLADLLTSIRTRTQRPVAILLDQFEDYVRCHANSELSDSFDAELARAVATRKGSFVFALQEHAIPAFERLQQHIPNLLGYQIQLQPLTVQAAREAIPLEASRMDLEVEPAALEALVSSPVMVAKENGIHPFFLKLATATFLGAEARLRSPRVRMATIEAQGGVERVVLESLDAPIAELGTTHIELLFRWCTLLISPEKHRLAVTEKGLTDYAGKLNRFAQTLLQKLTEMGMLRTVDINGTTRYELARDCLTSILRDWWERREAAIVARRRAVFRVRSVSVAAGAIVLMYIVWLIWGK
jgi:hypothetical protein